MDPTLVNSAAVIITLLAAGAFAATRGRVINLKGDLEDANRRTESLRAELADMRVKSAEQETVHAQRIAAVEADLSGLRVAHEGEVSQLRQERDAFARGMTGETYWQAISEMLDHHHASARESFDRIDANLTHILAILQGGGGG